MNIVIDNQSFPYDIGVRLTKLKYDQCPFEELSDIWDEIVPFTFQDIHNLTNIEQRRVAIKILGLERIAEQVHPVLVDKQTIDKTTSWINKDGKEETINFQDTYELYEVNAGDLFRGSTDSRGWNRLLDRKVHYVKFKDTSTDREYMIWVDLRSVFNTNHPDTPVWGIPDNVQINAIEAIAWTVQTNVPAGNIDKIIRQGDCILIKPKTRFKGESTTRHLTEAEYRNFLVAES
jgi:hypothetical protein